MEERILTAERVRAFSEYLRREEKSEATCEKYLRDVGSFRRFLREDSVTRETVSGWKESLVERGYAPRSVNSMLASVNSLLTFLGWQVCRVKNLRLQRQTFRAEEKELTRAEYLRLLNAARGRPRLQLALQTICATGIRVSELRYFTVEAARRGEVTVACKNKTRKILIPAKLQKLLLRDAGRSGITGGVIFRTRTGRPMNRSHIWAAMKALCQRADVNPDKVFPHNLRKLFARTFYNPKKDIAKLADVLDHSSIDTTRSYIMTTGQEYRRHLERLRLLA